MKLVLVEDIRDMKDIPQSINQVKNELDNGEIAFRIVYEDVRDYLKANIGMFSDNDARNIIEILNAIDSDIPQLDRKTIRNDQGNVFASNVQNNLNDLEEILSKYLDGLSEKIKILRELYSKKDIYEKIKDRFSESEQENYEIIFDSIDKAIKSEDPKLMTDERINYYRDSLEDIDLVNDSEQAGDRIDKYDVPFEKAKTEKERRDIIRKFFSDEEFWGENIGYYKLSRLGSPFITELFYRGFNEKDNPFIPFLKEVLPTIDIPEEKYRVIHNLFVRGDITEKDLRNKNNSKISRYIRSKELYNQSTERMEELLRSASTRNSKSNSENKRDWHDFINAIGINENNFKQCMSAILEEYAENENARMRFYNQYQLPRIDANDLNQWRWRLEKMNIDETNYRDILKYIYNRYNKEEKK